MAMEEVKMRDGSLVTRFLQQHGVVEATGILDNVDLASWQSQFNAFWGMRSHPPIQSETSILVNDMERNECFT